MALPVENSQTMTEPVSGLAPWDGATNPGPKSGPPLLTPEQLEQWHRDGYLALDRVTSPEDVAGIRATIQNLFQTKAGFNEGAQFNLVGKDDGDPNAPNISQIVGPRHYAAQLRKTEFFRNASALALQLLGPDGRYLGDHTLDKPALVGPATPWHQDEAFRNPEFDYNELSVWMPLQAVNDLNGCMQFIPGTNHGDILPHRSFMNDKRIHSLECYEGFDPGSAVVCPLPAGGCTIHSGHTLHSAGPNRSEASRYAYVLVFGIPPVPAKKPRSFPWLDGKSTGRLERMRGWMRRGGLFIATWRFFREANFRDLGSVIAKLRMQATTFRKLWRKKKE
jgi:hypothetical protein